MPPVDEVRTPADVRTPVASGRSPDATGPAVAAPQLVHPFWKTPLMPSESTPTFTPDPSTPYFARA
jgi:hypothetical protein